MRRTDLAIAAAFFAASSILYIRTLAPSLLYGDSAEFQTIAYTLGMGHPTGYPVYVLLARLFILFPSGEIAYRINLFSAFCAALTVGLVYLIPRQLGARTIPSLYGALVLALSSLFWKHASIAEIYTASAACLALILLAVFQWQRTNQPHWLFLAGLTGGLSLGIHVTVAFIGIPILAYLFLSSPTRSGWLQGLFGTVTGLTVFLLAFLLLDRLNAPAGYYNTVVLPSLSVWGMTPSDFDSPFERLGFLFISPQFKEQFFAATSHEVVSRFMDFTEGGLTGISLVIFGLVSLSYLPPKERSSRWREAILLAVALLGYFGFAVTYNVEDYRVYYVPVFLLLSIFTALGVNAIVELAALSFKALPIVPLGLSLLILILGFYSLTGKAASHWRERVPPGLEDWEAYFFSFPEIRRFEAEQTVNKLEDNAILFTDWDHAYNYYYVAHVLQGRTGMSFHETFPQEGVARFADSAIQYIEENLDRCPIYFDQRPSQLAERYNITRAGSGLFQIKRK